MRIAMVSEHASPLAVRTDGAGHGRLGSVDAGGQNVHVHALAEALARVGHEVVVHTRRTDPHTPDQVRLPSGVVVDHVPAGPAVELGKDDLLEHMDAFGAVLRRRWSAPWGERGDGGAGGRPDVAHAHFWMSGLAALDAGRALGVPVVQTFHALGSVKRRHQGAADTSPPSRVALESDLGAQVDRVVATCADEVRELVALGVPVTNVDVVPCGVDVRRFAVPDDGSRRPGPPRVLTVSRLVPRKGVDTAIRALARVPGPAELVVAGGPEGTELAGDPEVARLRALAADEGVAHRVRFVGRVGPAAVPELMGDADIVVQLPAYEPFGLVPLEAMASGRPVVAAEVGGLADTVVDGVTGLHVPPGDPDAAGRAIASLLADPAARTRLGRAGRARVMEHYAWDRVAAATVAVYRDVLDGPARAAAAEPAVADLTGVRS
ncbi:glycosyltransferase [Actinomycetospora sp. NBRC 106378]|uniref:glycosyltransferase n=1 Tax=Actinomycetospora sp. NBRC 106378 TaxID=3032208 RepID=UPI0024A362B2|nr:glycosyltransferase [Actinomycetospora sp. NBRC 106378]GLZ55989.1 glycosyl transferase [Actinomycetospora sp. NBRC 106378]